MHPNKREIIICLLAFIALGVAASFFYRTFKEGKEMVQVSLYDLVAPEPSVLLIINRPSLVADRWKDKQVLEDIFSQHIPTPLLTLVDKSRNLHPFLFSVHSQGTVLYVKANHSQVQAIEKEVLGTLFSAYAPQRQKKYGIEFVYYPDTENRFLGYYEYEGIWVVSYSRKLLEEVALQQLTGQPSLAADPAMLCKDVDTHSPLNILFKANLLDLYVDISDTTEWRIQDKWLAADLFFTEGHLCSHGAYPYYEALDTLYTAMGDTLSMRLQTLYPRLQPAFEIHKEENTVYYTGCTPLTGNGSQAGQ
ncbi:MAG: hypothetical protein LIP06_01410 [Tannerellaceae bacterium]|nr:hypothetical protein [Tannerellaceae bacterium]